MTEYVCPICRTATVLDRSVNAYAPFCSRRCKTIDLGRWLGEGYRIPAEDGLSIDGSDLDYVQGPLDRDK